MNLSNQENQTKEQSAAERDLHEQEQDSRAFLKTRIGPGIGRYIPLQDAWYVIHTITFFAVSCPENPVFFRKNWQIFENIPRKILHILNILEKCCILEKTRKNLVTFGENSAKFWQNLRIFGKKAEKNSNF